MIARTYLLELHCVGASHCQVSPLIHVEGELEEGPKPPGASESGQIASVQPGERHKEPREGRQDLEKQEGGKWRGISQSDINM